MVEVCNICNKPFGSKKALGGHMRVHYMISKNCDQGKKTGVSCKQCGKVFETNRSLSCHMKCHRKRSRIDDDDLENKKRPRNTEFYGLNESCSVTSEGREVEWAAESLMMISAGVRNDLVTEMSDDDGSDYFGAENDSEMSLSSENLDVSDDPDFKLDAWNKTKVTSKTSVDLIRSIDKTKKERLNEVPMKLHCAQDSMESSELGETDMDETISEIVKSNSSGKARVHAQNSGLERTYSENAYKTYTELTNQYVSEVDQLNSRKNGVAAIVSLNASKSKEYKCPVCFKVFSSGQAMGGHKRSHFANSKSKEETGARQEIDEMNDIDLNFLLKKA